MTLPKFPQPTEIFNPSGERYRVWREEFVAWLHEELENTQRRFPRWESELEKFQKKVLEAMGEQ